MDGLLEPKDIVFTKDADGEILSGGFSVNSIFFKLGMSPLQTLVTKGGFRAGKDEDEDEDENEVSVSKLMYDDGFAVPIGLLCERVPQDVGEDDYEYSDDNDYEEEEESNVLSDDLYERLLGIQTETNAKTKKKKMTRKKLSAPPLVVFASGDRERKQHKKTRKHKLKEEKKKK
jgi:hypothetical protein